MRVYNTEFHAVMYSCSGRVEQHLDSTLKDYSLPPGKLFSACGHMKGNFVGTAGGVGGKLGVGGRGRGHCHARANGVASEREARGGNPAGQPRTNKGCSNSPRPERPMN